MSSAERFNGANIIDAGKLSPYWGEHAARYVFALPYVENNTVLDIACGTGYGLSFLKNKADLIVGVDIDIEAAKEACNEVDKKTAVLLGDGTKLPFSDESFDVITSFETLEHLHQRDLFLAELKRVLKRNGFLLLSTPNAHYTKPQSGKPKNRFHVYEYKPSELKDELRKYFKLIDVVGQSLNINFGIPPFYDAQMMMPKDLPTQARLFCWRIMNKLPLVVRENLSQAIWRKPFYPTEQDYDFTVENLESAPVTLVVCQKID